MKIAPIFGQPYQQNHRGSKTGLVYSLIMSNAYYQQILAANPHNESPSDFQIEKYNKWGARNGYYTEDSTLCYESSAEELIIDHK